MKKFFSFLFSISLLVGLLTGCSGGKKAKHEIPDAPPCYVQLDFHGKPFTEYAAQGQVWLLFESSVSPQQAEQILAQNNAKILGKQPEIGYYIVEVEAGTESAFVAKMKDCEEVDYVYPNAIYKAQSATPCVIDNYYGDHGDMVSQMMREASNQVVKEYDVHGNYKKPEDKARYVNGGKIYESLLSCIYFVRSTGSVVINLSSGPPLNSKLVRPLWHEQRVSDDDRDFYVIRSINEIVGYVKYTRRYYISSLGNNFVIVKSAGNEGMPNYETILNGVYKELSSKEIEFFKDHFMIVSAKDDYREGDYPNEISNVGYNEMFTKVDISDKTAVNLHWQGTSYSSPRLAGYIVRAANEFNLNATDVLPHVRRATQKAYNHVIDYEMIEEEIKDYYGIDRQCRINEYSDDNNNQSDQTGTSFLNDYNLKVSKSTAGKTNTTAIYLGEEADDMLGRHFLYEIPSSSHWFNNGIIYDIALPNGDTLKYKYVYDDNYSYCDYSCVDAPNEGGFRAWHSKSFLHERYTPNPAYWQPDIERHFYNDPKHYIAFMSEDKYLEYQTVSYYTITIVAQRSEAYKNNQRSEYWLCGTRDEGTYDNPKPIHKDAIYEFMGKHPGSTIMVSIKRN